ncbi:hypothetical protein BCR41DRAFT_89776 [Lobosporangium transversale]|uniref:Uncharacterized protein n=1 Tax=Lobosporangium transversale TaxID=64571 RepID=A0A1Y2GMW5_9FUNG|nr:hypothetical protein BCR41DRAFT_89776 [Lobosporangium transversale]ORZ13840.1 hypothetical protein BCR41DRAFT_89776 [Lobosporangium transversale]|eukprot:XP_021880624.1 hypothetical protein BCR41DRAFT_89776 [Lobosporangium transversale]
METCTWRYALFVCLFVFFFLSFIVEYHVIECYNQKCFYSVFFLRHPNPLLPPFLLLHSTLSLFLFFIFFYCLIWCPTLYPSFLLLNSRNTRTKRFK